MRRNETEYMNVAARLANSEVGYGFESMDAPVETVIEIEDKSIRTDQWSGVADEHLR